MSDDKLKTGKIGETVIGAYKKVEDAFVDKFLEKGEEGETDLRLKTGKVGEAVVKGYKEVEDTVVGAYKKIEDAFVDTFLEKKADSEKNPPESDRADEETASRAEPNEAVQDVESHQASSDRS